MAPLQLLIADDHPIYLTGLDTVIEEALPNSQRTKCSSRSELLSCLVAEQRSDYDLLILDLHMPGFQDTEALKWVRQCAPELPVVVVSSIEDPSVVKACIELGAFAFVPKSSAQFDVVKAIRSVLAGYVSLPASTLSTVPLTHKADGAEAYQASPRLTARQKAVLQLTVMGLTNKGIGKRLGISDGTVKTHLAHLMDQFGVHTRTELVFKLAQTGFRFDDFGSIPKPSAAQTATD